MILVRFTIDNRNRLIFYGNTVGYVKDDAAVVDEMFQTDELSRYLARLNLTPQWKEGIFDRLAAGETPGEELGQPQKGCRIWQLRKGVDVTMRFIGYEDLIKRFGEPDADNYTQVFDGDQHLDGGINIALAGIAADGAAVEGGDGGLAVDGGSLGSIGDILEQLLHKVHSSCK